MSACIKASATGRRRGSTWHERNSEARPMLRKPSIVELGDSVPEPLGFNALAPECCSTLKALARRIGLRRDATRAPMQGPEWQGAASPPPQTQTQTPPDLSLLRAKNGLDNGVHFRWKIGLNDGAKVVRVFGCKIRGVRVVGELVDLAMT